MVIDFDKHNKKVLRAILRGEDPTDVMILMAEQYSNQVQRIKLNCKHYTTNGKICGQCKDVLLAYEYAASHLRVLQKDIKQAESKIKYRWSQK